MKTFAIKVKPENLPPRLFVVASLVFDDLELVLNSKSVSGPLLSLRTNHLPNRSFSLIVQLLPIPTLAATTTQNGRYRTYSGSVEERELERERESHPPTVEKAIIEIIPEAQSKSRSKEPLRCRPLGLPSVECKLLGAY